MSKTSAVDQEITVEENRPKWNNKLQYLLSSIGFAVGYGNIWRFPYLCQTYGGGAFLIPYVIALVFEGIPIFQLELAVGQLFRRGPTGVWPQISPYLGGLGYSCVMVSFIISVYYNMILAWVVWYLINSFLNPLPWSICPQSISRPELIEECNKSTPALFFWYRHTLNISTEITQTGTIVWWLLICLIGCWLVVFFCTIRGIETTGKAIYLTTLFPYLILTVFVIYGLTLPGAIKGLVYLFTPNLKILKNPRAWLDAATQIFFSLSISLGGHIAYSSYNPKKNDCQKDSVIIAAVNSLTSMYAAISIFSILGFKATLNYHECLDKNINLIITTLSIRNQTITRDSYPQWLRFLNNTYPAQLSSLRLKDCDLQHFLDESVSGPGLAFIVFTEVVLKMPGSQLWATLFFLMLFTLGLSSMFGLIQGILTPLTEISTLSKYLRKEIVCGLICLSAFLIGLLFTARSGIYWLEVFDSYGGSMPLLVIAFFELFAVIYIYGLKRFCSDMEWMTGKKVNWFWRTSWLFTSPLLMVSVFVSYLATQQTSFYGTWNPDYADFPEAEPKQYPTWIAFICGFLPIVSCLPIPIGAIYHLGKRIMIGKDQALHSSTMTETSTQK